MKNKQTAVDWLIEQIIKYELVPKGTNKDNVLFHKAKQMEKEHKIEFAYKVLQNAECSFTGIPYLEKDIDDIYNETYKQQENDN
jgi:hypothetical protein